ncbi:MAG: hypothetical protein ACR2NJ_02760 [Acidimicrobiales bacterium]
MSLTHSGRYHYIQTHHIFPKAITKDYEPSEVNEIANFAFISGGHNRSLSAKPPDAYLPAIVESRGPEALTAQGIPLDRDLWKLENFRAFLEYRRAELARMVNDFLDRVVNEGYRGTTDIGALITQGEGPDIEFKETARFDVRGRPRQGYGSGCRQDGRRLLERARRYARDRCGRRGYTRWSEA